MVNLPEILVPEIHQHLLKMLIYKDALSDNKEELLTDTYRIQVENGFLLKVKAKLTTESTDIDERSIGGNASAEGCGDEGGNPSSVSGIDVCIANRLQEFPLNKRGYKDHIKEYMGRVVKLMTENGASDEEKKEFQKKATGFVMSVIKEFDEYQFFVGETMNVNGMMILCRWDEETPYLYYFKHGLEEEKV